MTDADSPRYDAPLDQVDPRFGDADPDGEHERELIIARGPFPDPDSASARFARFIIPAMAAAAVVAVVAVFVAGLGPGSGIQVIGEVDDVRAVVEQRPRRVCFEGELPCAWLTVVHGELLALNTSGPLPEEFGRAGVGWCEPGGVFGSDSTGSRYDRAGDVLAGPSPRGLDRYGLIIDQGLVSINFFSLQTGARVGTVEPLAPSGPDCPTITFDRDADLDLS